MQRPCGPEHRQLSSLDGEALREAVLRDPHVARVVEALAGTGGGAIYLVGGALRDCSLGRREVVDLDLVTAGDVRQVAREAAERLSARTVVLDERWGVIRLVCPPQGHVRKRVTLDLAAMQGNDIREDLARRDFTCNAMALLLPNRPGTPLRTGWVDPFGGLADLRTRTLRMVAPEAFREDPVRMLRGFRLSASLGLRIEERTLASISEQSEAIRSSAGERVREELIRLFSSTGSYEHLAAMDGCGLLKTLFPEIEALRGLPQGKHHHLDAWSHCLETFRLLEVRLEEDPGALSCWSEAVEAWIEERPGTRPLLKMAALFHDVGKPAAFSRDGAGGIHFYAHAGKGAEIAGTLMKRIRASRVERERVGAWIRHHMGPLHMAQALRKGELSERARIRFLRRLGPDAMGVILLSLADVGATRGNGLESGWNRSFMEVIDSLLTLYVERGAASPDVRPPVTGGELIENLGIPAGPRVGRLLRLLAEAYIEGKIRGREETLALARVLHESLPST